MVYQSKVVPKSECLSDMSILDHTAIMAVLLAELVCAWS